MLSATTDEIVQGARLINFLPYIEEEINKMIYLVEQKVATHIREATLTPDLAYNFWLERHSYTSLLNRFQTKVKLAQAQGDKNRAVMEAKA